MPGAQPHPQSSWAKKENAHKSSGRAEIARHSLRNGFTAYSALSPESGLVSLCHERNISVRLIPASGDQDHAASPYASISLASETNPSIAPRATSRGDSETPSVVGAG